MKYFLGLIFVVATASAVSLDFQPSLHSEHPVFSGARNAPRIVGGDEVPPHAVPYQVGLFLGDNFCSGSLINSRYVLTSAHCGSLSQRPVVVLGAHRIKEEESEQISMVSSKVILHPHWNRDMFANDIALIMLPRDVKFTKAISPITLAPPTSGYFENQQSRVTGWGVTSDQESELTPTLRYTLNPILPNRECQRKLQNVKILDVHLCFSGEGGRSPCLGDAGAPVIAEYQNDLVQIGIVSFMMERNCRNGYPVGLTRVSKYYYWIQSNM